MIGRARLLKCIEVRLGATLDSVPSKFQTMGKKKPMGIPVEPSAATVLPLARGPARYLHKPEKLHRWEVGRKFSKISTPW